MSTMIGITRNVVPDQGVSIAGSAGTDGGIELKLSATDLLVAVSVTGATAAGSFTLYGSDDTTGFTNAVAITPDAVDQDSVLVGAAVTLPVATAGVHLAHYAQLWYAAYRVQYAATTGATVTAFFQFQPTQDSLEGTLAPYVGELVA